MVSILQGSLAEDVAAALEVEGVPYDLAVRRTTVEGGNPADPGSGTEVTTDHPCRGFRDEYETDTIDGSLIQRDDVRVFIIASSLSIQATTDDRVVIDGTAFTIINVKRDPAGALLDVQARA